MADAFPVHRHLLFSRNNIQILHSYYSSSGPVCGFDGLVLMGYAGKQMNTVQQNFAGISAAAVEELQYLLQGGEGREVILPHTIVRMKYLDIIA